MKYYRGGFKELWKVDGSWWYSWHGQAYGFVLYGSICRIILEGLNKNLIPIDEADLFEEML